MDIKLKLLALETLNRIYRNHGSNNEETVIEQHLHYIACLQLDIKGIFLSPRGKNLNTFIYILKTYEIFLYLISGFSTITLDKIKKGKCFLHFPSRATICLHFVTNP